MTCLKNFLHDYKSPAGDSPCKQCYEAARPLKQSYYMQAVFTAQIFLYTLFSNVILQCHCSKDLCTLNSVMSYKFVSN